MQFPRVLRFNRALSCAYFSQRDVKMPRLVFVLCASILAALLPARAAIGAEPGPAEPPGWLLGAGYVVAPNPFGAGVDTVSTPLPLLGYIGERLTWLGPYLRYEFVNAGSARVAGAIETRFEGIPDDVQDGQLAGIRARKPALEAGADAAYGPFIGSARVDVSGRHDGYELSLGARQERRMGDAWLLEGRVGAVWQSADLTSHLYGVHAAEARTGLDAYEPGGALNYEATLSATYRISRRWMALGSMTFRLLDDDVSASPIVYRDHDVGGFVGLAYRL
jgi:outer membrane protein